MTSQATALGMDVGLRLNANDHVVVDFPVFKSLIDALLTEYGASESDGVLGSV